ncbi:hypothetical protein UlMin_033185 [Ulmus minor]
MKKLASFPCTISYCLTFTLGIYNEQITDLLEPSSTNLQLREDLKKGVYVENLIEYNVRNVDDVVKILLQVICLLSTQCNSFRLIWF